MNDQHFDSVAALMRCEPSEASIKVHGRKKWVILDTNYREPKYGVPTLGDVVELSRRGWPDGLRRIRESLRCLNLPGVASVKRRRTRGSFGDSLDIHRVYSGQLDTAWSRTERTVKRGLGRIVTTLLVGITASWGRSAEEFFWRGAVATTIADMLERSGRRVRIVGFMHARGVYEDSYDETTTITFNVKQETQLLDLERLAFVTALSGFFRVWMFRAMASPKEASDDGLGHPVHLEAGPAKVDEDMPPALHQFAGNAGTIIIDDVWNKESAQKLVDEVAAGFGLERISA